MPKRFEHFYKGGFYHLFNKSVDHRQVFNEGRTIALFKKILLYYNLGLSNQSYSKFIKHNKNKKLFKKIKNKRFFSCLAYCFMPNHFHFLIRQNTDESLSKVIRQVLISFTRTYNQFSNRCGPLFIPHFQAVEINNEHQLIHVSRYIHLNPYSSGQIENLSEICSCTLSSMPIYLGAYDNLCEPKIILDIFGNNRQSYQAFVLEQAKYQRQLEVIKKSIAS